MDANTCITWITRTHCDNSPYINNWNFVYLLEVISDVIFCHLYGYYELDNIWWKFVTRSHQFQPKVWKKHSLLRISHLVQRIPSKRKEYSVIQLQSLVMQCSFTNQNATLLPGWNCCTTSNLILSLQWHLTQWKNLVVHTVSAGIQEVSAAVRFIGERTLYNQLEYTLVESFSTCVLLTVSNCAGRLQGK